MRGADLIFTMRQKGIRPAHVHVLDYPANPRQPRYTEDWAFMDVLTHGQPPPDAPDPRVGARRC